MIYDGIVIGAGHAGIEAALALAKKHKTLLISGSLSQVASLPCNPSIGGPAKGVVVREIDALGGVMGKAADLTQIQIKMLNSSKGPAVRALRAQIDKLKYPQVILKMLKEVFNLTLLEGLVNNLLIQNKQIKGVCLVNGQKIYSKTVIITTGTYLASQILIGSTKKESGPNSNPTTYGISQQLKNLGFEIIRLKTGTSPRIKKSTIDYTQTQIQLGDNHLQTFSFNSPIKTLNHQEPCFLTHTNEKTHQVIQKHLSKSAMYGGHTKGAGPRYCPSIEDKVVRFYDKNNHQIFIEPESLSLNEMYLQGLSTSMPENVQHEILKTIPGLQNAEITKYAYAIEYDVFNPNQLKHNLETKKISHLFFAGQMNGTSGYEEAACQGLMAGINASLKLQNKPAFVLKRNEAYIGVLIDDLITKGTQEPYRLLTSRAEFRLLLRHDNADLRLKDYGYQLGLIDDKKYYNFNIKKEKIKLLLEKAQNLEILPNESNLSYLQNLNSSPFVGKTTLSQLLKRPELNYQVLQYFLKKQVDQNIYEQVEIQIKYEGYIAKAKKEAQKLLKLEGKIIPKTINYLEIHNLSQEAKEKLNFIKPETLGQASRILGVNQVDLSILLVYLEKQHALL
ncbi:tRNA uridine-5-carboxymethylaminomethyl(34) synthesis enzyme MnmG ['Fragaria x ananassa' phyllody phytoplasma]|uniref:tRNA uridine 5-carboxymethylaminomethyl modification enzyme MnmG n=1 Tax='Fragaria x ananassa' phyllody phytoplasma TaxID=2358428 RepID=A0ABS5K384_9MOLU|nr:tRNA uridine-5-carboxymethylaminomethyl(34) synthesis enzyme MnmG ['Fragaria x ananassa' phyllody phytoplasma]MBS2126367.1 tRNA uridine-5-carboxymethylaminomethyl(34) synthesis enzyme MnmG ['Fragaria x ananassa' phyllody phytoplasma]